ncbi:MAG: hypothetical protein ACLVB5_14110 [Christensenellales bacterium]
MSPQSPEKPVTVDQITTSEESSFADRFDTVKFGGGICICTGRSARPTQYQRRAPAPKREYLSLRCVRFTTRDYLLPNSPSASPFTLVAVAITAKALPSVKLRDSAGTRLLRQVDLGSQRTAPTCAQSDQDFTYQLVMSAEIAGRRARRPLRVSRGDYIDLEFFPCATHGNLPPPLRAERGSEEGQRRKSFKPLRINCTQPQESTNEFLAADGNLAAEQKGVYTIRRVDGMYDALNGESWNITSTNSNGVTTGRQRAHHPA